MVVKTIYVVRHGFRSNWVVDATTGTYHSNFPSPTGIASDPALASKGVEQAQELATHLSKVDPPVEAIYSSPFYRCIQTLMPTVTSLNTARSSSGQAPLQINLEHGLGEFYGLARFDHPLPATNTVLATHFDTLHPAYLPVIRPSVNGESIPAIHDRIAYCLHHIIKTLDADPKGPETLLICTHAAVMICIGRVLTGRMPTDHGEDDFNCYTCAFSKFVRRTTESTTLASNDELWDAKLAENIPSVGWQGGRGVQGGWNCEVNGDCSFLSQGPERGWRFTGDESFIDDPNAYVDPRFDKSGDGAGYGTNIGMKSNSRL